MLAVATRSSSTRQDIANESCGLCGEKFGAFGRAIIGTCKHKICISCVRQKDKERGSGNNVAKGAFLPCPLPSCDGKFTVPEVVDLLSSDEEDEVEVGVSSPVKQEECTTSTHVKSEVLSSTTPFSTGIVSSPVEKKIKLESVSYTGATVTPPQSVNNSSKSEDLTSNTNKAHIKSENGKGEIKDTDHKEAGNLKPSTNEIKVVKSEEDTKSISIRKPLFNGGDKVVSAYWDPEEDPNKEHDHGGYFPGTIVSSKTIGSSKYGPIRTYHIKYDD